MLNVSQMLKSLAREKGIGLEILQKDYALSYLLAGIEQTPGLGNQIALKGGTALKKVYYSNYRFSEDLDYSTTRLGVLPNGDALMQAAVERLVSLLNERGPFEVLLEALTLRLPHPGQQMAYTVRVRFPDQRQSLCRLKVEITVDEPVLLTAEERPVLHEFAEPFQVKMRVYTLAEIVAEKLRALLQSQTKLTERGWGASRVCRDYYDLWFILGREKLSGVPQLVTKKCAVHGIGTTSPRDFVSEQLMDIAHREWDQQLRPFVPDVPEAERVLSEVRALILHLYGL
jgi:predicted nucleotidyltransferase component of viral defense system